MVTQIVVNTNITLLKCRIRVFQISDALFCEPEHGVEVEEEDLQ